MARDSGGGAIANSGPMTITNSTFYSNSTPSTDFGGGGIINSDFMTIINSTFNDNSAGTGGGIRNVWGSTMVISNCTFSGNSATEDGGGINNVGTLSLINSTLSENSATEDGGGVQNYGSLFLANSTFSSNSANDGGGIWSSGTLTLSNSIIANSPSGNDCSGSITSLGYNLDSDGTCQLTSTGDMTNTNPILGPLQNNGGDTYTHALLFGSPAIDAGNDNECYLTDQRGVTRPQDGNGDGLAVCDIGSFELNASSVWFIHLPTIMRP